MILSLPSGGRRLQFAVAALVYLSTASLAHASMACWSFDQLATVSDPLAKERLEAHAKALPGLQNPDIRQLQHHYFLVQGDGKFCKPNPRCEHRLLYLRDGVVRNVFAYRGTGAVWRLLSPLGVWWEYLQDEYSGWAFEMAKDNFVSVDLPRYGDMIFIDLPGPDGWKVVKVACDGLTK